MFTTAVDIAQSLLKHDRQEQNIHDAILAQIHTRWQCLTLNFCALLDCALNSLSPFRPSDGDPAHKILLQEQKAKERWPLGQDGHAGGLRVGGKEVDIHYDGVEQILQGKRAALFQKKQGQEPIVPVAQDNELTVRSAGCWWLTLTRAGTHQLVDKNLVNQVVSMRAAARLAR